MDSSSGSAVLKRAYFDNSLQSFTQMPELVEPWNRGGIVPAPISRSLKSGSIDGDLRRFADDCEEMARQSGSDTARSLLHFAAKECRTALRIPFADRDGTLAAMRLQAKIARWFDGDTSITSDYISGGNICKSKVYSAKDDGCLTSALTRRAESTSLPVDAMNARQLGHRFGMSERGARKRLENGMIKGLPGFYRVGCHWYAVPDAFDRASRARQIKERPASDLITGEAFEGDATL